MRRVIINEVDEVDDLSPRARRCVEALYWGMAQSTAIKELEIDPDLFPDGGDLPPLNLKGTPLSKSLQSIKLNGYDPSPTCVLVGAVGPDVRQESSPSVSMSSLSVYAAEAVLYVPPWPICWSIRHLSAIWSSFTEAYGVSAKRDSPLWPRDWPKTAR
eukprot:scaffold292824_cov136-Cyclotella_meneghiniana.AAC.1